MKPLHASRMLKSSIFLTKELLLFWYLILVSKKEYILTKGDALQNLGYLFHLLLMGNFYL